MQKYTEFIGIDVSKSKLDLTLRNEVEILDHQVIENESKAIQNCLKTWTKKFSISKESTLICLEHTGRYMHLLLHTLSLKDYPIWVENATVIKRSIGLQRGKSDKADAHRIAEYAFRYQDKTVLYVPASESLQKLKALETTRNQLVQTRKRLQTELKESASGDIKMVYQLKKKSLNPILKPLDKQIKALENQMDTIIKEDNELKRLTKIMTSVVGVGKVTATALLIVTQGFTKFDSAKKLACYCGVVPFEHTSGSSVRGKTRTSNFANKHLKSLLHLCALSAIRQEGELKQYYQRKVKEGKKKMVALNAVRNKIIQRVFACVQKGKLYEKNYSYAHPITGQA